MTHRRPYAPTDVKRSDDDGDDDVTLDILNVDRTLAVCFLHASDVTRKIAASLAFQFFSLFA